MTFEGTFTVDVSGVLGGGVRQRSTTQGLLDLGAGFDLDPLLDWKGGTAWVEVWTRWGRLLNADVGDAQGSSNIDAPSQSQVAQLWFEQWLVPDRLRVKLGRVELFDEFAVVNGAGEFLNNGVTYTPSFLSVPSYPQTAWSVGLYALPTAQSWLSLAVFDGSAQDGVTTGNHGAGTFVGEAGGDQAIAEAGCQWPAADGRLPGRLGVGLWHHGARFDRFAGGTQSGASGGYALLEQALWREQPGVADDVQGVDAFVQGGSTDGDVADIQRHAAAGLTWTGMLPEHDADIAGLGATMVSFTAAPGAGYTADHELALEAFYMLQLGEGLSIKPDLQWIGDPGGDGSAADAWVATLRFTLAW
ncbi:MAG TPA: carbohydrate porin [Planctomycetota bacterium]|nr:carbohydrate porin [Planctomycetota bacterium]